MEEVIRRLRDEPASLASLLVELGQLLGPLNAAMLDYVALQLRVPAQSVRELASAHRLADTGETLPSLGLCSNGPCATRGGTEVERILSEKGIAFERLRCQGACDLGPIACYHRGPPLAISAARARSLAKAEPAQWEDLLSVEKPVHAFKTEVRVAFANLFAKGSHQMATARRHGVYDSVDAALQASPQAVLAAVEESHLVSAKEAAPVAVSWRAVRDAPGKHKALVLNGSEWEPGVFKDRLLLERDPHLVLAGAILAAYAVGASEAYLCVRGEYELALERVRAAVEEATRAGLLGEGIGGTSFALNVHVRLISSACLAGENSALLELLEGKPPLPRLEGPPLTHAGLFGRPTLVQDVETLACIPSIVEKGGAWYRSLGVQGASGVAVVSLTGDLKRPGGYELPRGTSLRQLVEGWGGGTAQGKTLVAVQVGGCSGAYLPAALLDLPFDEAPLAEVGAAFGSGGVMVVSEKSCLYDLGSRETAFFARQTCGHCEGCRQLASLQSAVERLGVDPTQAHEVATLAHTVRSVSRCDWGRHAATPIESILRYFPEAPREHAEGLCSCAPRKKAAREG